MRGPSFRPWRSLKIPAAERLHRVKRWRDRLLSQGDSALQELLVKYPGADRPHLRQLIRKAEAEKAVEQTPRAARLLFEYLRELMRERIKGRLKGTLPFV